MSISIAPEAVWRRWDILTAPIREALVDNKRFETIRHICRMELNDDSEAVVRAATRTAAYALMGLVSKEELAPALKEVLRIDDKTAGHLSFALWSEVIHEFDEELAKVREAALAPPPAEEEEEVPTILKGREEGSVLPSIVEDLKKLDQKQAVSSASIPEIPPGAQPPAVPALESKLPGVGVSFSGPSAKGEEQGPIMLRTEGEFAPVSLPADIPIAPYGNEPGLLGAALTPPPKPPSAAKIELGQSSPEAPKIVNYSQFIASVPPAPIPKKENEQLMKQSPDSRSGAQEQGELAGFVPAPPQGAPESEKGKSGVTPAPTPPRPETSASVSSPPLQASPTLSSEFSKLLSQGGALPVAPPPPTPRSTRVRVVKDESGAVPFPAAPKADAQQKSVLEGMPILPPPETAEPSAAEATTLQNERPGIWARLKGVFAKNKKGAPQGADDEDELLLPLHEELPASPAETPTPAPTTNDAATQEK